MATKTTAAPSELISVEELRHKHKTPAAVLAGVRIQKGWRYGKYVTEAEYLAAVKEFLSGRAGG